MLRRYLTVLVFCIVAVASNAHAARLFHAIHISYTQAEWKNGSITGKATYFKDDYTKAVDAWTRKSTASLPMEEQKRWRDAYFKNYFRAWMNGVSTQLNIAISQVEDDGSSYIFHFVIAIPAESKNVTLDNRIIHDQCRDQTNLLNIIVDGHEVNHAFTSSNPTFKLPS